MCSLFFDSEENFNFLHCQKRDFVAKRLATSAQREVSSENRNAINEFSQKTRS